MAEDCSDLYIAEARLQDMDQVMAMVESHGLGLPPEAVLHTHSLVAKQGDRVRAAAVASFTATGESVIVLLQAADEAASESDGEAAATAEAAADAEADVAEDAEVATDAEAQPTLDPTLAPIPLDLMDRMAHKACKKLRAHRNHICRIKHPDDETFWRSVRFIKPAA